MLTPPPCTPLPSRPQVLQIAGIEDCYTSSTGSRKTLGNFVKATFDALSRTYGFLTPDLWRETKYIKSPLQVGCVHACVTLLFVL